MPALAPYIPNKDADFANWSANFSTLITASPGTYGLVAGDATAIAASQAAWAAAYALAVNPSTRTPTTVAAKGTAKINLLAIDRPYAQTIANNAGVTSGNKIALGLNPKTSTPAQITAPTTAPVLSLVSAPPLQHIVRYRDETASPTVKSKPYGVVQIQIFATASATVITDPNALLYKGVSTKSPFLVSWDSADKGKQAYYAARWITRKGLTGPFSTIVNFTVAG
jgi:hypothetical protein